jgi:hypothetical protein
VLKSPMETGMSEGYKVLDEVLASLLAEGSSRGGTSA